MEVLSSCIFLVSIALTFLIFSWKVLNWVWITPKKMEKILRAKGFKGNSYRLLIGDLNESANMDKEAKSKPIHFTHDIIPRVFPFICNLVKHHGKNTFTWFGPKATVLILEPDQIKEIFSNNNVYLKLPSINIFKLIAGGLSAYDQDKWAKHRRLINPAFNLGKLKLMLPSFHLSCSEMLSKWNMMASTEQGSFELDVWPHLQALTCDVISRTALGSNYEEGKKIFEMQRELIELVMQVLSTVYIPGMLYLPTKRNRRIKALAKEVQTSLLSIINRRVKAIEAGKSSGDDLLGILLESNLKEIQEKESDNAGMSFEEIVEECKLFYFAGQETTASLLVWTMILLGKHLDWQDRARDEVRQIFGENKPDYEGLSHLKVMNMIFNEVLRLYPPAGIIGRRLDEDTTIGDQTLPGGILIFLYTTLLHHDENIWGPDAKEFKPERFSEGIMKATKGQHAFFPFGSGPRVCIGQNFAILEAKMAMSMILKSFSFELSPLYAHAPYSVVTLQPQHGAQLILHKLCN